MMSACVRSYDNIKMVIYFLCSQIWLGSTGKEDQQTDGNQQHPWEHHWALL